MTTQTNNQDHQYYAANGLGWACSNTLEDAIEKLWHSRYTDVRKWLANAHKAGEPGLVFWTCRVPLPPDAHYKIDSYAPQVEGLTECANYCLTYYSQKQIAYCRDPKDEINTLSERVAELERALAKYEADHHDIREAGR